MNVLTVTKDNFLNEILNSDKPVLLDFWATWCGPCKLIAPIVDEIATETPSVKVGKVNIEEEPELASAFSVMSIPTLVLLKDGKVVNQIVGARPKQVILSMLGA